ncbi:hypothetical protein V6N13_117576 [Hibiscus sabdariffa]
MSIKEEKKDSETNNESDQIFELVKAYKAHNPYMAMYYHIVRRVHLASFVLLAGFHLIFGAGFTLPSVPRQMAKTMGKRGKEIEGANAG